MELSSSLLPSNLDLSHGPSKFGEARATCFVTASRSWLSGHHSSPAHSVKERSYDW
jgi:hypothetical protein